MVQLGADLDSTKQIDAPPKSEYKDFSRQQSKEQKPNIYRNQIKHSIPTTSSISAWRAMLERSNKKLENFNNAYTEAQDSHYSDTQSSKLDSDSLSLLEDIEESLYLPTDNFYSQNITNYQMQKDKTEAEQKLSISNYQQSLMSNCMELIDAWISQPHSEQDTSKIKVERSASPDKNNWASVSSSGISNNPTNETQFTVKQEDPSESANETDLSCTPSPSAATIPASKAVSTFNNNLSQVSHATTAATNSSSMVVQNSPSTAVSPSTNSQSMMAAATASSQHSFTLTPLPHIPSGYSGMCAPGVGSSYFPSGCSGSSVRFGNANQQHHSFDGSFPSTWTPFGGAGMVRPNYNGIQGFMSGQNQVFPGSTFQGGSVSNTEGSSSFFTHGGGGLTVQSPAGNQNVDRGSRGGDSNGSSPQSVGGSTNSPHLSHGIFGQNLEEGHGGAGGANNTVGIIGGGVPTRKREIRLIKNREAARECRRKKKEYIKCLENRVAVLENQNKALIEELKSLKAMYSSASSTKVPSNDGSRNNQMDTR